MVKGKKGAAGAAVRHKNPSPPPSMIEYHSTSSKASSLRSSSPSPSSDAAEDSFEEEDEDDLEDEEMSDGQLEGDSDGLSGKLELEPLPGRDSGIDLRDWLYREPFRPAMDGRPAGDQHDPDKFPRVDLVPDADREDTPRELKRTDPLASTRVRVVSPALFDHIDDLQPAQGFKFAFINKKNAKLLQKNQDLMIDIFGHFLFFVSELPCESCKENNCACILSTVTGAGTGLTACTACRVVRGGCTPNDAVNKEKGKKGKAAADDDSSRAKRHHGMLLETQHKAMRRLYSKWNFRTWHDLRGNPPYLVKQELEFRYNKPATRRHDQHDDDEDREEEQDDDGNTTIVASASNTRPSTPSNASQGHLPRPDVTPRGPQYITGTLDDVTRGPSPPQASPASTSTSRVGLEVDFTTELAKRVLILKPGEKEKRRLAAIAEAKRISAKAKADYDKEQARKNKPETRTTPRKRKAVPATGRSSVTSSPVAGPSSPTSKRQRTAATTAPPTPTRRAATTTTTTTTTTSALAASSPALPDNVLALLARRGVVPPISDEWTAYLAQEFDAGVVDKARVDELCGLIGRKFRPPIQAEDDRHVHFPLDDGEVDMQVEISDPRYQNALELARISGQCDAADKLIRRRFIGVSGKPRPPKLSPGVTATAIVVEVVMELMGADGLTLTARHLSAVRTRTTDVLDLLVRASTSILTARYCLKSSDNETAAWIAASLFRSSDIGFDAAFCQLSQAIRPVVNLARLDTFHLEIHRHVLERFGVRPALVNKLADQYKHSLKQSRALALGWDEQAACDLFDLQTSPAVRPETVDRVFFDKKLADELEEMNCCSLFLLTALVVRYCVNRLDMPGASVHLAGHAVARFCGDRGYSSEFVDNHTGRRPKFEDIARHTVARMADSPDAELTRTRQG